MKPEFTLFSPMPGATKNVAYTGTAGDTAAMPAATVAVWVLVTTDAFIRVGTTATTSDMYLPAYTPVVISCPGAQVISAIRVTTSGTLYATPIP